MKKISPPNSLCNAFYFSVLLSSWWMFMLTIYVDPWQQTDSTWNKRSYIIRKSRYPSMIGCKRILDKCKSFVFMHLPIYVSNISKLIFLDEKNQFTSIWVINYFNWNKSIKFCNISRIIHMSIWLYYNNVANKSVIWYPSGCRPKSEGNAIIFGDYKKCALGHKS